MKLPKIEIINGLQNLREDGLKRTLIFAAGFEARSTALLDILTQKIFHRILLISYVSPQKKDLTNIFALCNARCGLCPEVIEYDRSEPAIFELYLNEHYKDIIKLSDEIVVDISVMSKLMIMILINSLKSFSRTLRIIYAEPEDYAPSEEDFNLKKKDAVIASIAPTTGVMDVVRTPYLTSLTMQRSPTCLIAFTSFNEQLVRALLYSTSPSRVILIGCEPPLHKWRGPACQQIHSEIIKEFCIDNQMGDDGLLKRKVSTLYYVETFNLLEELYNSFGVNYRIFLAPTGSKMQAVGCALAKIKFSDIHIEYPIPESFVIEGYSSSKIKNLHQILFLEFDKLMK